MFKLLIFGGTTEGRQLAEFCSENGICADVSVTTDYGASLLPEGVNVLRGKLDAGQMTELLSCGYSLVVDATHPYAVEATGNIRRACESAAVPCLRLIRRSTPVSGKTVSDMDELVRVLNAANGTILSTLGSKSLAELANVTGRRERLWLRLLPSEDILEQCRGLGFDTGKIILHKGPFTVEQNAVHIRKSGAKILLTKESGTAGGYAEKAEAARICGAELITLMRPVEQGHSFEEVIDIIGEELNK